MDENIKEIISRKESNNIKQIYITGALGGFTSHDFRLIIFNEKPMVNNDKDTIELIRDPKHEIIMSFSTAKELNEWLSKQIKNFEEENGEI